MKWLDPRIWIALIGAIIVAFISGYLTKARSMKDVHSSFFDRRGSESVVVRRQENTFDDGDIRQMKQAGPNGPA